MSDTAIPPSAEERAPKSKPVVRKAIGPKLRIVFSIVLLLTVLILANSVYLVGVKVLEWKTGQTYQDFFYICMFLMHIVVGLLLVLPFIVFGFVHWRNAKGRRIRRTVNIGYALLFVCIAVLVTGFLLVRIEGVLDLRHPTARSTVYWLHVGLPVAGGWLYLLHRLVGPKMRWKAGLVYAGLGVAAAGAMILLQSQDPRDWNAVGPESGVKYFEPSLARTSSGNFIPASTLDMNEYCLKCHADAYAGWQHSVHKFSSFNNPAYLTSIQETRKVAMERDGNVQSSRWCAGCHDPVPFFSGAFDDPEFDVLNHPTAASGITCTTCHAITHVNSQVGNADYTIEEPQHYPFAQSENEILQWVNNQLVKAKPSFHRKTFLKPLHQSAEFCSTCHKVHLPIEVTKYREFLRGQNHYDSWLLSGVSGHGSRSFYYPPTAQTNCNGCHMPLRKSDDFGAKLFDGSGDLTIHEHLFPSANTAIPWLMDDPETIKAHQEFLQGITRVDIFGVRSGGRIDGELTAPLRPEVPTLKPGETYLLEAVIRTLKLGHHFTQGTTDSNEIWLDVEVRSGDRIIGRSGALDNQKAVDPWAHRVNTFMLDRDGNRIDRRNAQDIFVPLYSHQIPPGAGQAVQYRLVVPDDVSAPITVNVKLQYRKFDAQYMQLIDQQTAKNGRPIRGHREGEAYINELPITTMAEDSITFPVAGVEADVSNNPVDIPEWQRWNDYGIGMLQKQKGALKQAQAAFRKVEELGRYDGPLNLARALFAESGEGQLDEAAAAIRRANEFTDPAPPTWTVAWLSGEINRQQGRFKEAEENFRQVLEADSSERRARLFDFSRDYFVNNLLGLTLYDLALQARGESRAAEREALLREAVDVFLRTLEIDPENVDAHFNLQVLYANLGETELALKHHDLHSRFKSDDTARGRAVGAAREKYPAANAAAESLVIYELLPPGTTQPLVTTQSPDTTQPPGD